MIKVLGNMDLSAYNLKKQEVPDYNKASEKLTDSMKALSMGINNKNGDILNDDASIKISPEDEGYMQQKELSWALNEGFVSKDLIGDLQMSNPNVKESYDKWLKHRNEKKSNLTELAIVSILSNDKSFTDQFVIVRASKYDDYENGVDFLILDKESNNVICGIDQVLGMSSHYDSDLKSKKVKAKNEKGGVRIKYGINYNQEKKKIEIKELKHLPAFFLSLSKNDLDKFLLSMEKNDKADNDIIERILKNMSLVLNQQFEDLNKNSNLISNKDLQENIKASLSFINYLNQYNK